MWASFVQDLKYCLRMLAKSPGFTITAVATLALGIGLNTTLFTVFNAVALKPLPVRDGRSLMRIERWFASGLVGNTQYFFSWQEYEHLKARSRSFPELVAVSHPVRVTALLPAEGGAQASRPVPLVGELVSANYFSQLAPEALVGRTFTPDENSTPGAHPVVVLSHRFWKARLSSDRSIVGRTLTLNGVPFSIVGVTSPDFIGSANPPGIPDFWAPIMMQAEVVQGQDWLGDPLERHLQLLGHEVPVAAPPRGASELSVLIGQFQAAHPDPSVPRDAIPSTTGTAVTTRISMQPATLFGNTEDVRFRAVVAGLMITLGMVLLIACANVANMLLARAVGRRREIGVRTALGASRARLVQQLLTESVLLSLIGGAAGFVLSTWASEILWAAAAPFLNDAAIVIPMSPDARVFAYAFVVSVLTGIVFGLSPALHARRADVVTALKDSTALAGRHWSGLRIRGLLVAGQVAVSIMFLISAGLLGRGLIRSTAASPGYETKSIYLMSLGFAGDAAHANDRAREALDRLRVVPQVADVAVVERPPMLWTWTLPMRISGGTTASAPIGALANHVSGTYFRALDIRIVRGRSFVRSEEQAGARVAVVSEATARSLWPERDPIGQRVDVILTRDGPWTSVEVVGVAADVRTANLSRLDPAMVYFPGADAELSDYWAAIRTRGDGHSAIDAMAAALTPLDARFATGFNPRNLEYDVVANQKTISRTLSLSATFLAILALVLTTVGIYGVMAFAVSQRVHEVGIRMALGASHRDVFRLMACDGLLPVAVGGIAGLAGSVAVSSVLRATLAAPATIDLLYGVGAFDPPTFLALTAFLGLVALTATSIPAHRATRVDPVVALRRE